MEMIGEQLGLRMMSSLSKIHAQRVRTGRIYDQEWPRIATALGEASDAQIWIDEEMGISPAELRARARRLHRECGGLSLVIIDYLQLMGLDKKVVGGKMRFVLLKGIGHAVVSGDVPEDLLRQTLEACAAHD